MVKGIPPNKDKESDLLKVRKPIGGRPRSVPTQVVRAPAPLASATGKLVEAFKTEPATELVDN